MAAVVTVEDVVIEPKTDLQRLAELNAQVEDFNREITEAEAIYGIKLLKEHRDLRMQEYKELLDKIVGQVQFSEDRFLKAIKKKGDSYREGSLKLVRYSRTVRSVDPKRFITSYPDLELLAKVCKVEVGKAEIMIGKRELDPMCDKNVTYSYEVFDLSKMDGWRE